MRINLSDAAVVGPRLDEDLVPLGQGFFHGEATGGVHGGHCHIVDHGLVGVGAGHLAPLGPRYHLAVGAKDELVT